MNIVLKEHCIKLHWISCLYIVLQFGPDMGPVGPGPGMHGPLGPDGMNPAIMNGNGNSHF